MGAPIGNQNARKARVWTEAIKRALARYSGNSVEAGLDKLADRMVKAAAEGDQDAWHIITEKIGDRLEGKPAQVVVGDSDADPLQVAMVERRIVLVKPEGEDKP